MSRFPERFPKPQIADIDSNLVQTCRNRGRAMIDFGHAEGVAKTRQAPQPLLEREAEARLRDRLATEDHGRQRLLASRRLPHREQPRSRDLDLIGEVSTSR